VIVATEVLAGYRGRVTMVDGAFDPIHPGHIAYFEAAAELGLPVLCNVSPDSYVARKHPPLLVHTERAAVLDALRSIDYTHLAPGSTNDVLQALQPRYYAKGADWRGRLPEEEVDTCAAHGIEIVYLDTVLSSSTALLDRYASNA
jgi:D-beta-D-heptose 7-phosphate kinase/D-beta-D-heptose 1-phosphate adenosyltransferase